MTTYAPEKNLAYHYIISAVLIIFATGGGYLFGASHTKTVTTTATAANTSTGGAGAGGSGYYRGGGAGAGGAGGYSGGGAGGPGGAAAGGGFVSGAISAVNGSTITITTTVGTTSTVNVSSSTVITKTDSGALSDLTVGENILARGSSNSDGSVAATTIQIRPATTTGSANPGL